MRLKIIVIVVCMVSVSVYGQTRSEWIKKADICFSQSDYNGAETFYKKAIQLSESNQDDVYIHYSNLGTAQWRNEKKKDALESFNMADKLSPNNVFILNSRASLKGQLKDYKGSLEDYAQSVGIDSLNEETLINRSHLFKVMGDTVAALNDLERILKFNPKSLPARNNYADVMMNRGKYAESMKVFDELLSDHPNEPILLNNKADVYLKLKEYDKAMEYVNKAIRIKDTYYTAYVTRGEIYMKLGELGKAKKDFQKAIKLGCDETKVFELLDKCN